MTFPPANIPYIKVGELVIPKQEMSEELQKVGELSSFNPWRSTLRPLGSIGRIREIAYQGSLEYRREKNNITLDHEPESLEESMEVLGK